MCTFAKYSQSLKYLSARRCCFYNLPARNLYAAVECNKRTVGNRCYTENVTASLNHTRLVPRYWSDKAEDKTEVETAKESSPGLFRRFHQTYKEHGKILMCVHLATSAVWAAVFYCVAVRYELYRQFCLNWYRSTFQLTNAVSRALEARYCYLKAATHTGELVGN